jgi:hypothetical protein
VTGTDLDERLHSAECFNIFALQLRREGAIPQGQNPDSAFTMRTYVHAQNDALKIAAASLQKVVTPS